QGVKKLQLIKDAKAVCPNLVIVNGEDLTPFRNASKTIFDFVAGILVGTNQMERLGFDEVSSPRLPPAQRLWLDGIIIILTEQIFIDVTALIDHNLSRL